MKKLTVEQVRANHWRKQFDSGEKDSFADTMKKCIGLHSTDYWTPYISVWARIGDFDAAAMYRSLNRGEVTVRLNAFRTALHLVSISDFGLVTSAVGPRFFREVRKGPELRLLPDREIESKLEKLVETLEGRRLRMRGLKQSAPGLAKFMRSLVFLAMARGLVVRAETSHARSTACSYALARDWFSGSPDPLVPEDEAILTLFLRYMDAFGPISAEDFAWWLPTTKKKVNELLSQSADYAVECSIEGGIKYMSRADFGIAESLEAPDASDVVFLPYEDCLPKAFRERSWYIDEDVRPKVFPHSAQAHWPQGAKPKRAMPDTGGSGVNQSGEIRPSIWIGGKIAGRWEIDETTSKPRVFYSLFVKTSRDLLAEVKNVARELEGFISTRLMPISA